MTAKSSPRAHRNRFAAVARLIFTNSPAVNSADENDKKRSDRATPLINLKFEQAGPPFHYRLAAGSGSRLRRHGAAEPRRSGVGFKHVGAYLASWYLVNKEIDAKVRTGKPPIMGARHHRLCTTAGACARHGFAGSVARRWTDHEGKGLAFRRLLTVKRGYLA